MFLLGLELGGRQYPWNSVTVIGLLSGSVAAFTVFLAWEHRHGQKAMFPLGIIRKREAWTSMLAGAFLMGGAVLPPAFYLPIYFQAVKGTSPLTSGLYVLPNILTSTLFAVTSGLLGMGSYTRISNGSANITYSQDNTLLHPMGPF